MLDWIIGSDFSFGLRVKSGTLVGDEVVRAALKKATFKHEPPDTDEEELVIFTPSALVTPVAPDKPYWLFSALADKSVNTLRGGRLESGEHFADVKIMTGANTLQTSRLVVMVHPEVTRKRS
jgi:hypothetical protein